MIKTKKLMKKYISFLISSLITISSFSQFNFDKKIDPSNCRNGENIEYCRTHHVMNELKNNPTFLKTFIADSKILKKQEQDNIISQKKGTVYTVPVVFHILHNGGLENISKAQIEDAISILNRDYRLQNVDAGNVQATFQGMPADIEIEFALATKAPNGQCFDGITRTQNALSYDGSDGYDQVSAVINGNNVYQGSWPGNKYLNIFVCGEIGGAAGYTTQPSNWSGSSMTNGIWVLHSYVGSIGTSFTYSSRTLTHEVGHWLNLDHCWGGTNNPALPSSCNSDDGIADTPNTIGWTSCNLNGFTCGSLDNVENYMEYSYCSKMFTSGQRSKMRAAITSSVGGRNNLWTTNNLNSTGVSSNPTACKAGFYVNRQVLCAGDSLQFTDNSYNNITGWSWTFQGGNPSVSTNQNPAVYYSQSGTYDITLQVTDQYGNTVSETFTDYINVIGVPGTSVPYTEDFENISSLPNADWHIDNPGNSGPGFQISSQASVSGSKSLKLDNSAGNNLEKDELISTTYNLQQLTSANISFKYAFAQKSPSNTDFLQILVSNDCGDSWSVRKHISASQLPTRSNTISNYTPGNNDWKTVTISNIVSTYLTNNFRFKIAFTNGGGNDLYIDDINISGVLGLDENETIFDFYVFPNPANNKANIKFNLASRQENISINMHNVVGKKVQTIYEGILHTGSQNIPIDISQLSKGIYFINITTPQRKLVQKLIIE